MSKPSHKSPVILITGASRGVGAATAKILAKSSCRLALVARSEDKLRLLQSELQQAGSKVAIFPCDLSDPQQSQQLIEQVYAAFGGIHTLINNAATPYPLSRSGQIDANDFQAHFNLNFFAPVALVNNAIPYLKKHQGRIINIGTGASEQPICGWSAYCSSKAALLQFTRVVAIEHPELVSLSFAPGVVDTDMQASIRNGGAEAMDPAVLDYFKSLSSQQQLLPPEVPARGIAWLALHADSSFSGLQINYDHPRVLQESKIFFG